MLRFVGVAAVAACLYPLGANAAEQNDLREFRVGMTVPELPADGYTGFVCADDPSKDLSGWSDYVSCPAEADGLRAVGFRYDLVDKDDGTRVGGQPVKLVLLIDTAARVVSIKIDTNPNVRLYMHRKAHLFALQVRARFGEESWTCRSLAPTPTEQPVGGVFVHEHCEKTTSTRHFILDRELYRDPARDLRDFTDATQLTIRQAG